MKTKNLVTVADLDPEEIEGLVTETEKFKRDRTYRKETLKGKNIALIFQKPSNRTRVSFEVGISQLGGNTLYLGPEDIQLGRRETVKDVALVLSRYLDGIVARTFAHGEVIELARHSSVPVINGLSDYFHPCQALSDIFTIYEKKGKFAGVKLAYVGDGNNVLHSLLLAAAKVGLDLRAATPEKYCPDTGVVKKALELISREKTGARINLTSNPREAVKGADFVYTDVWTSMGREGERTERLKAFRNFQVNEELLSTADKDALVMHCLPAHRGEEITGEVMDGPRAIVYDQAENRMHMEKAILSALLG